MTRLLYCFTLLAALSASAAAVPDKQLDSMAQRTAACVACHGEQGRATAEGFFPRIAGKPAGYLHQQLINFQRGRRVNPAMTHMVARLPDAYLKEIAAHFAAQQLPYPTPQSSALAPAQLAHGRRLVLQGDPSRKLAACIACHGQQLTGVQPAIPGLLGLPRDYLTLQLSAWRQGSRRAAAPDCMAHVARTLTAPELVAVAAWLSSQPVPNDSRPALALTDPMPARCGGMQ